MAGEDGMGSSKKNCAAKPRNGGREQPCAACFPPVPLPHLHPDHVLQEALRRLGDLPLLPVVNRANFRKLEGVVGLPDILGAYRKAG
jgi:hypothetical protein